MFLEDSGGPKRAFKCFTAMVLKSTDWRQVHCFFGSTAAAVWCRLTAEEAEAGLVDADVLAVWWWLEKRRLVAGQVVNTAAVC